MIKKGSNHPMRQEKETRNGLIKQTGREKTRKCAMVNIRNSDHDQTNNSTIRNGICQTFQNLITQLIQQSKKNLSNDSDHDQSTNQLENLNLQRQICFGCLTFGRFR